MERRNTPFLIGVAGGTSSGKSTVCQKIMDKLSRDCQRRVALVKQDSFYRHLSNDERNLAKKGAFNFDHPDAVDEQAIVTALTDILSGKSVRLARYDYQECCHSVDDYDEVQNADVVLFEGILIFYFPKIRELLHMKLFVDTDPDTRLSRRVVRDVRERGRPLEAVLNQYNQYIKPAFEEFCLPTKKYADMIIPRGAENEVAIGLINHNVIYLLSGHTSPKATANNHLRYQSNAYQNPYKIKNDSPSSISTPSSDPTTPIKCQSTIETNNLIIIQAPIPTIDSENSIDASMISSDSSTNDRNNQTNQEEVQTNSNNCMHINGNE